MNDQMKMISEALTAGGIDKAYGMVLIKGELIPLRHNVSSIEEAGLIKFMTTLVECSLVDQIMKSKKEEIMKSKKEEI